MQLGDILDDLTLDVATGGLEITHVDIDSRECVPGSLFFALPGSSADGVIFASDAVAMLHEAASGALRDLDRLATAALREAAKRKKKLVERDTLASVLDVETTTE